MTRILDFLYWLGSCWNRQPAPRWSCLYCGIPHVMTLDEFWEHQHTVHPFTRNGVAR